MKRVVSLVTIALLTVTVLTLAVGCQSGDATSATTGATQTSGSSPSTSSPATEPTASQVFAPHELLTAEEATELTGHEVTMDEGTLFEDPASGTISERYKYDLDGTGIHALVEIHQDGFKPSEDVQSGNTVLSDFAFELELSEDEITSVDVGEQAFTFDNTGQLHMYYKGYYIVVAFDADPYDNSKNAPLNILLGKRILTNLQEALQ